jgi:hypothetical protein
MTRRDQPDSQIPLPLAGKTAKRSRSSPEKDPRISHARILELLQDARPGSNSIICLYRERVLPVKTRTIQLLGRKGPARIMNTLLGYEVQAGYKRIQCPDLVTARYLRLFSELGCRSIRLPYDPTITAALIPQMETAVESIRAGIRAMFPRNHTLQLYVLRQVFRHLRARLTTSRRQALVAAETETTASPEAE